MTLLFKIINLMANLKILSDPLLALQMLYEGKGGGAGGGGNLGKIMNWVQSVNSTLYR